MIDPHPLASSVIDGGTIILALLILAGIVAICAGFVFLSLWLTAKVNGSKGLVWGALLGVTIVYLRPLLGLLFGNWGHVSFVYESFLPAAAAASAVACTINLVAWKWNHRTSAHRSDKGNEA